MDENSRSDNRQDVAFNTCSQSMGHQNYMCITKTHRTPTIAFFLSTGLSASRRPVRVQRCAFARGVNCALVHRVRLVRRTPAKMVSVLDSRLLALTALVTVTYQLTFFFVTYMFRFDTLTDFAGSTNFALLALLTLVLGGQYSTRGVVLSTFVFIWAARLCAFLLSRILAWGEDRRFDDKRENFGKLAAFWAVQAVWVWTVSLPLTIVNSSAYRPRLNAGDYLGWAIFIAGLLLETVADAQKTAYKKSAESRGRWTDVGTWSWSRHPNYAGEIALWWGVYISSTGVLRGAEHLAVLSPIFITTILLFLSGIPLLEEGADKKHGKKSEYLAYKKCTSVLIPLPPSLYEQLPERVKKTVLLDFALYNKGLKANVSDVEAGKPDASIPIIESNQE